MKREYLTTEQGNLLAQQMGIDAILMFTIQELNDYITQYNIAGIANAASLLIQSECQNNQLLSDKLKIDPFVDLIIATEAEGTNYEEGIVYFDVSADVGKKKPKVLGTAIAIDYYNCVQTIVEHDMLQEDQALTADEVVKPAPQEVVEVIEEVIEEPAGPSPEEIAAQQAAQAEQQKQAYEQQMQAQQQAYEQQMQAQKQAYEQQMQNQQQMQAQQQAYEQQLREQQQAYEQQLLAQKQEQEKMLQQAQQPNNPVPIHINYAEIYADEIATDSPDANVKYYSNNNEFLNKVHYANTHGYQGKKEYDLYKSENKAPTEFKTIDYVDDFDQLTMPYGPNGIEIEDLDSIGNSGYVPYPYGPLKRPPVPYDL